MKPQWPSLERIVDVKPDDFTSLFNLAYKHSGMGNKDVALHHYLQIPMIRNELPLLGTISA